jgi:hypothetical protein
VNKIPLYSGPYDAIIKLQPYKSVSPIILPGALTVMNPELDPFSTGHGSPGDQIATTGRFFGTKKGKVYLEDPSTGKKMNCKVSSWSMDPGTGESTLTFVVPKGLAAGRYPLKVTNKVGTVEVRGLGSNRIFFCLTAKFRFFVGNRYLRQTLNTGAAASVNISGTVIVVYSCIKRSLHRKDFK